MILNVFSLVYLVLIKVHMTNIFTVTFPAITTKLAIASTSTCLRLRDEISNVGLQHFTDALFILDRIDKAFNDLVP